MSLLLTIPSLAPSTPKKKGYSMNPVGDASSRLRNVKREGLLNEPGWRCFKSIAKCESRLLRMTNQANFRSFRHSLKYKFGYQVAMQK